MPTVFSRGSGSKPEPYSGEVSRARRVRFEITTGEWKFTYSLKAIDAKLAGDLELKSVDNRRTAKVNLSRAQ
jgi:hypothetical protein